MLPYTRAEEFRDRYSDSVIYYKGSPWYVAMVNPREGSENVSFTAYSLPLNKTLAVTISATDKEWSDINMNLGYLNDVKDQYNRNITAVYCSRMPARRSKQGLDAQNVYFKPVQGNSLLDWRSAIVMETFVDMMCNRYPSWNSVLQTINKRGPVVMQAFHKDFALEMTGLDLFALNYKGTQIASSQDGVMFTLARKFLHLKEVLTEQGVRIAV